MLHRELYLNPGICDVFGLTGFCWHELLISLTFCASLFCLLLRLRAWLQPASSAPTDTDLDLSTMDLEAAIRSLDSCTAALINEVVEEDKEKETRASEEDKEEKNEEEGVETQRASRSHKARITRRQEKAASSTVCFHSQTIFFKPFFSSLASLLVQCFEWTLDHLLWP